MKSRETTIVADTLETLKIKPAQYNNNLREEVKHTVTKETRTEKFEWGKLVE
jgi:hypothetical protein